MTDGEYLKALISDNCISCGKHITIWDKVRRLFWAPVFCKYAVMWNVCCSRECYFKTLEQELELALTAIKDERRRNA